MRVVHLSIAATRHAAGAAVEALLIAALIAMAAIAISPVYAPARSLTHADTAFAAKGGRNALQANVCTVGPASVQVGDLYTVSGGGLSANLPLLVRVQDSHGSQYMPTSTDASGAYSVSSYASWGGTSTVTVSDTSGQKSVVVASCSFAVN